MRHRKRRDLLVHATINVLVLLGVVLLAPLAARAQTPPAVPIAVGVSGAGSQESDYSVQVGGTTYVASPLPSVSGQQPTGGFQVVVLDRATLALVSNQTFSTGFNSETTSCAQQAVTGDYLKSLSSSNLVIVSSVLFPVLWSSCSPAALVAGIEALGGTAKGVLTGSSYSLVGIGGVGVNNGWEQVLFNLDLIGQPGPRISGYLVQDVHSNYTFLSPAFVKVVTRTTDGSNNPAIQVESGANTTTYTAPALPAGALGGYQVLMLDRLTLQPLGQSNQSYATNAGDTTESCQQQAAMAAALSNAANDYGAGQLVNAIVIVSSILDPGALVDPTTCGYPSSAPSLADGIGAVGGTGAALGAGVNYSLISGLPTTGLAPEASSLITPGTQAQLTAILQPDHQSLYAPVNGDVLGTGSVSYDLYGVIAQPPQDWPVPAAGASGQAAAFQYVSYILQCPSSLPAAPPPPPTSFPACASGGQSDCANIRAQYCTLNPRTNLWQSAVQALSYGGVPAAYQQQFSALDFAAVQTQLGGNPSQGQQGEFGYVDLVSNTLLNNTLTFVWDLAVGQTTSLSAVLEEVEANANPSKSSNVTVDTLEAAQAMVYVGSAFAAFADPEIQAALGLTSTAIGIGLDLSTSSAGGSGTTVQTEVEDLASVLFDQTTGLFAQSLTGVAQLFNIVLSDWGKLQAAGQHVQAGDAGWTWPDTSEGQLIAAMTPAFEISFYQNLLPIASDIVFFEDVKFSDPGDYQWDTQACERCEPICQTPYSGAPSYDYWNSGGNIYLLDPYPSSTLAKRLFNSPTDSSAPGLGIFKPQLFQRIRGWGGLKEVKPVSWSDGLLGCSVGAPAPLLFQGKAGTVGAASATVSLWGTVALTGPIDLSAATVFVRQVLTEADGGGELVLDGGGARFLPLELGADPGGKADRAVFQTAARTRPSLRLDVKNRKGQLEVKLTVEHASIPQAPQSCGTGPSANLRHRLVLDDHRNAPVALNVEQPWQCRKGHLTTP